jgi:hypothetical protein
MPSTTTLNQYLSFEPSFVPLILSHQIFLLFTLYTPNQTALCPSQSCEHKKMLSFFQKQFQPKFRVGVTSKDYKHIPAKVFTVQINNEYYHIKCLHHTYLEITSV